MNQSVIWRSYCGQKPLIWVVLQFTLQSNNLQILVSHVRIKLATSMLMKDVGDEMWSDNFEMLVTVLAVLSPTSLSFNISVGHQQPKDVTNIEILSLTCDNCHQDKITNIYVAIKFGL